MRFEKSDDAKQVELAAAAEQIKRITLNQFEQIIGSPFKYPKRYFDSEPSEEFLTFNLTVSANYGIIATRVVKRIFRQDDFSEDEIYSWSLIDDEEHPVRLAASEYSIEYDFSFPPTSDRLIQYLWELCKKESLRESPSREISWRPDTKEVEKLDVQRQLDKPWSKPNRIEWSGRMADELSEEAVFIDIRSQERLDMLKKQKLSIHLKCNICETQVENPQTVDNPDHDTRIPTDPGGFVLCQSHASKGDPRVTAVRYHRDTAEWFEPLEVELTQNGPKVLNFTIRNDIICTECLTVSPAQPVGPVVEGQVAHCCPECESLTRIRVQEESY